MSIRFENLSDDNKSARLLDYAQGRLGDVERAEIDLIISNDTKLAEELSYYQGLANAAEPASQSADHEFGWARLSKSIDAETHGHANQPIGANDNSRLWKIATLALGLIAIMQAGFMMNIQYPQGSKDAVYVPVAQDGHLQVQLIFVDTATSNQMNTLLNELDAKIVAGPSALGLYDVLFTSPAQKEAGLKRLSEATDIVESVTLK